MSTTYSIYEAKAKFSEMIRKVKHHNEVIVTERGTPVARLVPFEEKVSLHHRLDQLKNRGLLILRKSTEPFPKGEKRPGALARFLSERE